ncbi:MAG TPA: cytochrome c maturation protein CcmE [Candidatus Dormibacteraeota bacterium]|nr:cytochrome c maturation protein CcmE [Candidatus Dormibacteraeota bacterium]
MILKWGLLAAVVAVCVGYLVFSATASNAQYYRTVAELKRNPAVGDSRVLGTVQDDVQRLDGGLEVRFTASQDGASMPVDYRGPLPDIFKPGIQVVVEGQIQTDGVFHAKTLLAKCPSRFTVAPTPPA